MRAVPLPLREGLFGGAVALLVDRIPTPGKNNIIYDNNPERIVQRVIDELDKEYADFKEHIRSLEERPKKVPRG